MTIEELASLVVGDVAELHQHLAIFREEVYAEGYAHGYDDAVSGKEPTFGETDE